MKINNELLRGYSITRRSFMLMSGQLGMLSLLGAKIMYMQLADGERYRTLSDKNRINAVMIPPLRGTITDKNGKIIATNTSALRVILDKKENPKYKDTIDALAKILSFSKAEYEYLHKTASKIHKKQPSPLIDNLSWDQVALIEENIADLPGIYVDMGQYRLYNFAHSMSHPIGYISAASQGDQIDQTFKNVPYFQIGKNGIEKYYEEKLQGSFGLQEIEVNAHGNLIREISSTPSSPGESLQINIDVEMQEKAMSVLNSKGSSAVILELEKGRVITMASSPGFDPNKFVGGVNQEYWSNLLEDPYKPLINKTIQNNYPPGSIFKMLVVLAALENGMDPNSKINCTGGSALGDNFFRCWYRPGHGSLNMSEAIEHSCNTYMYHIAKTIGAAKIAEVARKFGLGSTMNIDLGAESAGLIPDPLWKKARFKEEWRLGDSLNTAIGQGFVLTTPLQLACTCAAIATGKVFTPRIVGESEPKILDVKDEHLQFLRNGMINVVNSEGGTSYSQRITNPNWTIAGKTGTSQVIAKIGNTDLSSNVPWKSRNHGLFIGYGPVHNPKFALSVVVDHGGGGASCAAPIAKELFLSLFSKYL
ncbi:MAG: Penicillin-binding protein [Pseudomonadota bacterium]|jgi:penicillin-binding protein 2